MPVLQSGSVTPGHAVKWVTNNVIGDAGALPAAQRVLAASSNMNFNTTSDQGIVLPDAINAFQLTGIIVTNASVALTTAVGGFYPAVSKGGVALVAASQVYSALALSTQLLQMTIVATPLVTRYSRDNLVDWTVYLSLTTAQGSAATADVYVIGIDLTL